MKITSLMKLRFFSVAFLAVGALLISPGSAQDAWEKATADKLARFLPVPVEGLVSQFPWDEKSFNQPELLEWGGWSHEEIPYEPDYAPAGVIQHWRMPDPKLLEQVKKAEKDAANLPFPYGKGGLSPERTEMERKFDEVDKKMGKAREAGDTTELQRLQMEYDRISAWIVEQNTKTIEAAERPAQLKESAREIRVVIAANLAPRGAEIWRAEIKTKGGGDKRNPVPPAATIQGYPVGRNPNSLNGGISYAIYLGPRGLKTRTEEGPHMRKEVKALFVMVEVKTNPGHQAADEALALKMLEQVDYAGLSKLLVP